MGSTYQIFKQLVIDQVPLSKDAIHIYIGLTCLVLSVLLLRIPARSYLALLLGLAVSLLMEGLDLRDNVGYGARFRFWGAVRDLVNTNLPPLVAVLLARFGVGRPRR